MTGILAILYHDVYRDGQESYGALGRSAVSYHVSLSAFARQLDRIASRGLPLLSLADLEARIARDDRGSAVFVCFDDGWRGTFEIAGEELARRGLASTTFVTTDFIGRPLFADAAQLRNLPAGMALGSHGRSHRMLSSLARNEIRAELRDSKDRLEQWCGAAVHSLSIPGGASGGVVLEEALEAGYTTVLDSEPRLNPTRKGVQGIGRVSAVRSTDDATFDRWLRGDLRREQLKSAVLGLPKRVFGMRTYSRIRRVLLGERGREGEHLFDP